MKKITLCFVLLMMSAVTFPASAASNLRGDVNGNNEVDISDVTALISYVLTGNGSSLVLANADCTLNGEIDISDVTCLIDYVLRGAWPEDPHEWVDLGLPSGTLWATCNIGADNPEDYGDYFAWGEIEPKELYSWGTYKWYIGAPHFLLCKYCTDVDTHDMGGINLIIDNKTELDPEDDAAYVNWGPSWRMPSEEQSKELVTCCSWQWTTMNGVIGEFATGPNGKTLFLPAAGCYFENYGPNPIYPYGYYWTRTLNPDIPILAFYICFNDEYISYLRGYWSSGRSAGYTVRAVRAQ